MKLPAAENFREVCTDVVVRFKGHDAYQGRSGALRAFKRRAPGFEPAVYEATFDDCCDLYDLAVVAIELFPAQRQRKSKYAEFEDIDYDRCMSHLTGSFPGLDEKTKAQILNWVIFWHYLK